MAVSSTCSSLSGVLSVFGDDAKKVSGDLPDGCLLQVFGQGGNDTINETNGALPAADVFGGIGNGSLTGGLGNDLPFGQNGNDVLFGEGGNKPLFGGAGKTLLPAERATTRYSGRTATTG